MCNQRAQLTEKTWARLAVGQEYRTPDARAGANFTITNFNENLITIEPQNITISRAAFDATIGYLLTQNHYLPNPCKVQSSNSPQQSGPLCSTSRAVNNNIRCINYILPLLSAAAIVGIGSKRPNTTWLL